MNRRETARHLARRLAFGLGLGLALAAPAAADWVTQAGNGAVVVTHRVQGWTVELRCSRSNPEVLGFTMTGPAADSLAGVTSIGIGAELPGDQRRAVQVPVVSRGQVATGTWPVGERSLEIFAQGLTMGLRLGAAGPSITTDMKGTAAARSAFRSQCGF